MKLTRDQDELSRKRRGRHAVVEDFFVVVDLLGSAVVWRGGQEEERAKMAARSQQPPLLWSVSWSPRGRVKRWEEEERERAALARILLKR